MALAAFVALVALVGPAAAHADPGRTPCVAQGVVFDDADQDGLFSADDQPLAGVAVFFESERFVLTDAQGGFALGAGAGGLVWARAPRGFRPGPVWRAVDVGCEGAPLELGLTRASSASSGSFIQMSDLHVGIDNFSIGDAIATMARAVDLEVAPDFLVVTGDLVDATTPEELVDLEGIVARLDVPFVPVAGNHDWHDGGPRYRASFGPPMYSFDAGGAHFIVLNFNDRADRQLAFVELDRQAGIADEQIVVFTHAPADDALAAALQEAGVDAVFSGHNHANQVYDHDGLLEYNTEPPLMGGLDHTPAGHRVITTGGETLVVTHETSVDAPLLEWVDPEPDGCLDPARPELLVAAATPGAEVWLAIDDGTPVRMTHVGGWTFRGDAPGLAPGSVHRAGLMLRGGGQVRRLRERRLAVCGREPAAAALAPPLRLRWTVATGAHLLGGAPVIVGGMVLVGVSDLADGSQGGVIAVDLASGAVVWRHAIRGAVRGSLAATDRLVVVGDTSGNLRALAIETGELLWPYDLGGGADAAHSSLYAPPVIVDGVVYAGLQTRQVALEAMTGEVLWQVDQAARWAGSYAGPAVAHGIFIMASGRNAGQLQARDAATGIEMWNQGVPLAKTVEATPVVDGTSVFVVNTEARLHRLDLLTGTVAWERELYDWHGRWGWGPIATPVLDRDSGMLFLPTPRGGLLAVDAETGSIEWAAQEAGVGVVRPLPYERRGEGFVASPVVVGAHVWAAGVDGVLRAIDRDSGQEAWEVALAVPVLAGLATDGETLIVPGYDGVLRAYVHGEAGGLEDRAPGIAPSGCAVAAPGSRRR